MRARVFGSICLMAALVFIGACKSSEQSPSAQASPVAQASGDEEAKEVPADLYKTMPIFPGAQVIHVHKPRGAMREIQFEVKNAPALSDMIEYYKDNFKKNEFRITSSLTLPARRTWSCDFNKDGRPATVKLYPADSDKSSIIIDLIYEMPGKVDEALLEPREDFDAIGPGSPAPKTQTEQGKEESKHGTTGRKGRGNNGSGPRNRT